jgi:hypothetical protein
MRAERTDKVFLVAKVGQTIISAALTDAPWRLPGDALVVPADADGSLQGSLARALRQAVASNGNRYRKPLMQPSPVVSLAWIAPLG